MIDDRNVNVEWGYSGKFNFLGTGATKEEVIVSWIGAFIVPIFIAHLYLKGYVHWEVWQLIVAIFFAFDLSGGMISTSLNSCKRLFNTPYKEDEPAWVKPLKNHMTFVAIHVHPIIISLIFNDYNWQYGLIWYIIFIVSAYFVYASPLYLKRPVSMLLILIAIMINYYLLQPIVGFEWLIPVLFVKIIYGHMVREEPYRPVVIG